MREPQRDTGNSGSIAAAPSPTSSRARPDGALVTHKLLSENPEQYRDAAVAGIRHLLGVAAGAADPGRADRRGQDGHDGGDQRAARAQGRADGAGDHARLPRRAAHRLPEPAAPVRPAHRAAGTALRARDRGRRAHRGARRGRAAARRGARCAANCSAAYDAGLRALRDRADARLPLHGARAGGGAHRARDRVSAGVGVARGQPADEARRARRHDGGRRLPVADPAPLRRSRWRPTCPARGCSSCRATAA